MRKESSCHNYFSVNIWGFTECFVLNLQFNSVCDQENALYDFSHYMLMEMCPMAQYMAYLTEFQAHLKRTFISKWFGGVYQLDKGG